MNMDKDVHLPPHLRDVAQLLAEGKSNQEIAQSLVISLHTSEKYVSELKRLARARDRVELVLMCQKLGSGLP